MRTLGILSTAFVALLLALPTSAAVREEILHGLSVDPETVSIDVTSTGCTEARDFRFFVKTKGASRTEVTVIRIEGDPCEAVPHVVTLQFPRKEIGLDAVRAFVVTNPFGALSR